MDKTTKWLLVGFLVLAIGGIALWIRSSKSAVETAPSQADTSGDKQNQPASYSVVSKRTEPRLPQDRSRPSLPNSADRKPSAPVPNSSAARKAAGSIVKFKIPARVASDSELPSPASFQPPKDANPIPKQVIPMLERANNLYRKKEFSAAFDVLAKLERVAPKSEAIRRMLTTTACHQNDPDAAKEHFQQLPEHDQRRIASVCSTLGVEL